MKRGEGREWNRERCQRGRKKPNYCRRGRKRYLIKRRNDENPLEGSPFAIKGEKESGRGV